MKKHRLHILIFELVIGLLLSVQVTKAQVITLSIDKLEVSCANAEDGRAVVVAEGGQAPYKYLWSNGAEEQVINNLAPGTYEVTVTDQSGNTAQSATGLIEVQPITIEINKTDGLCGKLGEAEVSLEGGVGPFQYNWSNGEFSQKIKDLEEGTYSVTVTDRGQCALSDSTIINMNGDSITLSPDFNIPTCHGDMDGYISITQSGGVLPVTYTWSNGSTGPEIENLGAETYYVFAEDAFGCSEGIGIVLRDPDKLTVELVNQNDALYALVEGGTPDYDYTWSNGVTGTTVINDLDPGDYSLTVEDAFGCATTATTEILGPLSQNLIREINNLSITPTLVESELQISLDLIKTESILFEIYSVEGQRLFNEVKNGQNLSSTLAIPNHWTKGLYLIKISGASGWAVSKKFIKQ